MDQNITIKHSRLWGSVAATVGFLILVAFFAAPFLNPIIPDKWLAIRLLVSEYCDNTTARSNVDDSKINMADYLMNYPVTKSGMWPTGADGHPAILLDRINHKNPTWEQLVLFLKSDQTDKQTYSLDKFSCVDYAEMLHNNAEKASWNAGFILVTCNDTEQINIVHHALNAFETIDHGLVYIDCTGNTESTNYQIDDNDKLIKLEVGKPFDGIYIFPQKYWPIFLPVSHKLVLIEFDLQKW